MVKAVGYIDGEIDDLDKIRVPVLDRGFLYGDSVYEVFRTYSGIPFMFDEHYHRLLNSARLSGMTISQGKEEIMEAIRRTVAHSGVRPGEDIYVRYQITRGEGPIDLNPDPSQPTRLIIIVKEIPQWNPLYYAVGMRLAVPKRRRNSVISLDPNIKGGNYMNNILALAEAKNRGADDCMMLDANRKIRGLTRKSLLELLKNAQVPAEEREVSYDELPGATECFVTSATREVMPVCALQMEDDRALKFIGGGGPLTQKAMQLYRGMLVNFVQQHSQFALF